MIEEHLAGSAGRNLESTMPSTTSDALAAWKTWKEHHDDELMPLRERCEAGEAPYDGSNGYDGLLNIHLEELPSIAEGLATGVAQAASEMLPELSAVQGIDTVGIVFLVTEDDEVAKVVRNALDIYKHQIHTALGLI